LIETLRKNKKKIISMMDDASSSLLLSFDREKGVCRGTTLSEKEYIKKIFCLTTHIHYYCIIANKLHF